MENFTVFNVSSANLSQKQELAASTIAKAKKGDEAAFAEIYNCYFKRIFRFIYFRVGHKEVAEDLCEDVFLKAYSKIFSISNEASFEGWLYQIARNKVIDYYRAKKLTIALDEVENTLEYETNVIDVINLNQDQQVFLKFLKELATEQQVVIKLKFLENLENKEIAELLHKNEGTIRVIQHRAIQKLRGLINNWKQGQNNL